MIDVYDDAPTITERIFVVGRLRRGDARALHRPGRRGDGRSTRSTAPRSRPNCRSSRAICRACATRSAAPPAPTATGLPSNCGNSSTSRRSPAPSFRPSPRQPRTSFPVIAGAARQSRRHRVRFIGMASSPAGSRNDASGRPRAYNRSGAPCLRRQYGLVDARRYSLASLRSGAARSRVSSRIVKAASLVEYNGAAYAQHLCRVFADDPAFQERARRLGRGGGAARRGAGALGGARRSRVSTSIRPSRDSETAIASISTALARAAARAPAR